MANYYPDQTTILAQTTIRRERLLPPDVMGRVDVEEGLSVREVDIVAQGVRASRYVVVDLAAHLGTADPDLLAEMIIVHDREPVEEGKILATDKKKKRTVRAPANGIVAQVLGSRIVLHTGLVKEELRANLRGTVVSVRPGRGVLIETIGGLVQGVWGNGEVGFGFLKMEPRDGLSSVEVDEFSNEWRGAVVVVQGSLEQADMARAAAQGMGGLIAASMSANLRRIALKLKIPILLTEGFGSDRMNRLAAGVLESYVDRQVSVIAHEPDRWTPDRPEVIIPTGGDSKTSPPPSRNEPLRVGAEVRILRKPYTGVIARVKMLPRTPQRIENGLRLPVAEVTLPSGRAVTVPLVNLELFGRG